MDQPRYESKTVKVLRGTEGRSIAKWERDGWELVDQTTGTTRSTLTFRKVRRPVPVRALAIGGAVLVLVGGVVTGAVLLFGGADGDGEQLSSPTAVTTSEPTTVPPATTTTSSASPTSTTEIPDGSTAPITDTTVDELLARLNSAGMGGIALGDRFRVTGELFEYDAWGVGAAGEYSVYLSADGGADDLLVFVDETDARGWTDGTVVEMVLESVEVTIDGETTDGWLRAQTSQTVSG